MTMRYAHSGEAYLREVVVGIATKKTVSPTLSESVSAGTVIISSQI